MPDSRRKFIQTRMPLLGKAIFYQRFLPGERKLIENQGGNQGVSFEWHLVKIFPSFFHNHKLVVYPDGTH